MFCATQARQGICNRRFGGSSPPLFHRKPQSPRLGSSSNSNMSSSSIVPLFQNDACWLVVPPPRLPWKPTWRYPCALFQTRAQRWCLFRGRPTRRGNGSLFLLHDRLAFEDDRADQAPPRTLVREQSDLDKYNTRFVLPCST